MNIRYWALLTVAIVVHCQAETKTCTAVLNGTFSPKNFDLPAPLVFYPRSDFPQLAKWEGQATTKTIVLPPPVEIECGKPYLQVYFETPSATGMMPPMIKTFPWATTDFAGNPTIVEEETLYGFGDSYDYPYPAMKFETTGNILIDTPAPMGVDDICKLNKIELPLPIEFTSQIVPDAAIPPYTSMSLYGQYRWDANSAKEWPFMKLELENPYVIIQCDHQWKYEATFEWPYIFDEPDITGDKRCKGEVHREMKMEGTFSRTVDNKIQGIITVQKPTVTFSGDVFARYTGEDFTMALNGSLENDESGKQVADIEYFMGGDGIHWLYTLNCLGASQNYSLFGAASNYLTIMMNQEKLSTINEGYIQFDADLDEKTFEVDMKGQGIVTIKRKWSKEY